VILLCPTERRIDLTRPVNPLAPSLLLTGSVERHAPTPSLDSRERGSEPLQTANKPKIKGIASNKCRIVNQMGPERPKDREQGPTLRFPTEPLQNQAVKKATA